MKPELSRQIFENAQISNFMKIRLVRTELFHADGETGGRTDRHDETNSRFSQFFERTKKLPASVRQDQNVSHCILHTHTDSIHGEQSHW
jgi:hypothetical protein